MRLAIALAASVAGTMAFGQTVEELAYPKRTDWSSSDRSINISMYVFNDVNGNGTYDLGDRAMAAVVVGMAQGGEGKSVIKTNLNGFANFKAGVAVEDAVITAPGTYLFQAVVPPGWRVTSGNAAQELTFTELPGSITGLGLERMMEPVGLTPIRRIGGRHPGGEGQTVRIEGDGGWSETVMTGADGRFSVDVDPGTYRIDSGELGQAVIVGEAPVEVGTLGVRPEATSARTIHFDDYAHSGVTKIPSGYAGMNWFNLNFLRRDMEAGSEGYANGAVSSPYVVYTSSGIAGEFFRDDPFVLERVMLTLSWSHAEGDMGRIEAWNGDALVIDEQVPLSVLGPVDFQPRFGPVTRVRLSTAHQWQTVMDDLTISEPK